jgi:nitronate monooxygenase
MGSVSTPDLAVAVADAGGVGSISALGMPTPALERLVTAVVERTAGVLAVNFLLPDFDPDAVAYAAHHVRMIDCFWFDPDPQLINIAHQEGALVCWQVGSVDEARAAVDAGSDLVVAQGIEAGGHVRGHASLTELLPHVVAAVDVPVLAAGGIADRASLLRVLDMGAAGARIGTRFVATTEAGAHPSYKQAIVDAQAGDTEITGEFADCPLCATNPRARVLRACIDSMHDAAEPLVGTATFGTATVDVTKGSGMPPGITASGNIEAMAMYAGQSVAGIASIEPADAVVRSIWPEHDPVAT